MKKGRFSGKNVSNRSLMVTCGSSDSTWLKSGLTVPSSVTASRMTVFRSRPSRRSVAFRKAGTSVSRKRAPVNAPYGIAWTFRPGEMSRSSSRVANWGTNLRRIVPADEDDVQVGVVVTDIGRRRDADRDAVARLALTEIRHVHAAGRRLRRKEVLELGGLIDALRDEARARRLSAQRLGREQQRSEEQRWAGRPT